MPTYYKNRKTGKIEGKFVGCDTKSSLFRNAKLYERIVTDKDLPLEVQPTPTPVEVPTRIELKSNDGTVWTLEVDNTGKIKAEKKS